MKLFDLPYIPHFDLLAPQVLYRVRHRRASAGTVKMDRRLLLLPPSHPLSGRFDVAAQPDAYFAERPEMAVYEGICRREATGASMALMSKRSLLSVQTTAKINLLDLRPHTPIWPVLQVLRFDQTQALAAEAFAYGFAGAVYRSAHQYGVDCFALWGNVLTARQRLTLEPLIDPSERNLHGALAVGLSGSLLPLVP